MPFLLCWLSAAILVLIYNRDPSLPLRVVFSWIHRLSGFCLFLFPTLVILQNRKDWKIYFYNIRQAWVWSLQDIKWLARIGIATINKKVTLPEQGKFNAGEKLNFMMVMTTCPLFVITGVMIWLPDIAFLSWLLHVAMAAIATPLMFGHIFMATINPDTRKGLSGMISGYADREWAKHHYRAWYRENFENRDRGGKGDG